MPTNLIVLAAGQGRRMNSDTPKVLHRIAGLPIFAHALGSAAALDLGRRVLVVGHGGAEVASTATEMDDEIAVVRQDKQLGTAHAVKQAKGVLADASGDALVLYGDTPFIRPETLAEMSKARANRADLVVLGFEAADPGRYGRLIMDGTTLGRIVEWKDASPEERAVTLCNSGVMMADAGVLMDLVDRVGNDNAAGEYYLTDVVELARNDALTATVVICDEAETLGINSRADLASAEATYQTARRAQAMRDGVTLVAPETVFFSHDTVIGRDCIVEPHVVFGPDVSVESGATIRAFCHLEGCHVGAHATVGPYTRLRPGAELGNGSRVGNFCEIKAAEIGEGAKVNHLSYIGDASVGPAANIGAGTITCNYDGVSKHRTDIGARAFIGSNTMLVAPVSVGDDAMTATATTVTRDVPDGALAIARTRQDNKDGFAIRLMDKLRAARDRKKG